MVSLPQATSMNSLMTTLKSFGVPESGYSADLKGHLCVLLQNDENMFKVSDVHIGEGYPPQTTLPCPRHI